MIKKSCIGGPISPENSVDPHEPISRRPESPRPPFLPQHEENMYLHDIAYNLQRIANVNEFFALCEIEERQKALTVHDEVRDQLTNARIEELGDKIKQARV